MTETGRSPTMILYANGQYSTSVDAQLECLRAHARGQTFVAREVVDRAHGLRAGRPRLRAVLREIVAGHRLVACGIRAVANSAAALEELVREFRARGAALVLLDAGINTTVGIEGAMTIVRSLAELERRRARDHAAEGQERARAEGRLIGRAPVASSELARRARSLREEGLSWRQVGRTLGVDDRTARRAVAQLFRAEGQPSEETGGAA